MNKAREQLAEMFLSCLQEERLPWNQPWMLDVPNFGAHHNPITGTHYRGVNAAILWAVGLEKCYPDPRWCTFKQAQAKDWRIKKGEKGTPIEFWSIYDTREKRKLTMREADEIVRQNPDRKEDMRPCSSVYTVFNGTQIDGIPELPLAHHVPPEYTDQLLEAFAASYLSNENIEFREGGKAGYSPSQDYIVMPPRDTFISELDYYDTLFHECAHSTGAENRLNRELQKENEEKYAVEELRAEIGGAFILSAAGAQVPESISKNNRAYIQSWAESVTDAPNTLFQAIKDAGTICDFVAARGELERLKAEINVPVSVAAHGPISLDADIEL